EEQDLKAYPVHIKFNTGMNRLGMALSQAEPLGIALNANKHLKPESVFTHFAASDDPTEREFTLKQIQKFKKASNELAEGLGYMPMRHVCNTMGVMNYPEAHYEAVRIGIGLYGYTYDEEINRRLKVVGTLLAPIIEKQYLNTGDSIGYSRRIIGEEGMLVGIVLIVYGGYMYSALCHVHVWLYLIERIVCVLGSGFMDMIVVDVTEIPCDDGDLAGVFGDHNPAGELVHVIGTLSYE